jgi:hypothetical protein
MRPQPQAKGQTLKPHPPQRVTHLHDGFIVAKVGIVQSTTAPAHIYITGRAKPQPTSSTQPQIRVPHPSRRCEGWGIERSETVLIPQPTNAKANH